MIGAVRQDGSTACMTIEGAINWFSHCGCKFI
jgi:hypothetical protein